MSQIPSQVNVIDPTGGAAASIAQASQNLFQQLAVAQRAADASGRERIAVMNAQIEKDKLKMAETQAKLNRDFEAQKTKFQAAARQAGFSELNRSREQIAETEAASREGIAARRDQTQRDVQTARFAHEEKEAKKVAQFGLDVAEKRLEGLRFGREGFDEREKEIETLADEQATAEAEMVAISATMERTTEEIEGIVERLGVMAEQAATFRKVVQDETPGITAVAVSRALSEIFTSKQLTKDIVKRGAVKVPGVAVRFGGVDPKLLGGPDPQNVALAMKDFIGLVLGKLEDGEGMRGRLKTSGQRIAFKTGMDDLFFMLQSAAASGGDPDKVGFLRPGAEAAFAKLTGAPNQGGAGLLPVEVQAIVDGLTSVFRGLRDESEVIKLIKESGIDVEGEKTRVDELVQDLVGGLGAVFEAAADSLDGAFGAFGFREKVTRIASLNLMETTLRNALAFKKDPEDFISQTEEEFRDLSLVADLPGAPRGFNVAEDKQFLDLLSRATEAQFGEEGDLGDIAAENRARKKQLKALRKQITKLELQRQKKVRGTFDATAFEADVAELEATIAGLKGQVQ